MREPLLHTETPDWVLEGRQRYRPGDEARRRIFRDQDDGSGSRWWKFWGRRASGEDAASSNPRDDDSANFASVQEEWASRTEEDPYWWSREEEEMELDARTGKPSWARGGDEGAQSPELRAGFPAEETASRSDGRLSSASSVQSQS
jgi:hypothetical protein